MTLESKITILPDIRHHVKTKGYRRILTIDGGLLCKKCL